MRRLRISKSVFEEVKWDIRGVEMMKVEPMYHVSIPKLIWEELLTGAKLERNGYREGNKCTLCGKQDGVRHYLKCEKLERTKEKRKILGIMKGKLKKLNLNPWLTYQIKSGMRGTTPSLEKYIHLRIW